MHRRFLVVALAAALAACDDGPGVQEPATALTEDEAQDVAAGMSDMIYADMDAEFAVMAGAGAAGPAAAPSDTTVLTRTFEFVRDCPRGGSVAIAGTTVAVIDRETMHAVIETEATRTHEDCVLPLRRHRRLIELDGAPNIASSARFEREGRMPVGPQTVSIEGAVDWHVLDSDRAGTCEIDVDIAWERSENGGYRTVDGVVCGREVHSETTWSVDAES